MRWVYLSPHFDDIALSCGAVVWEQAQQHQPVEVYTICAGSPDPAEPLSHFALELHQRWGTGLEAVPARRLEDEAAVKRLGAQVRYWDLPDCIYRRLPDGQWLVNGEDDLWQPIHPLEDRVIERMSAWISSGLSAQDVLVSPLTLGNHVDHRLVRAAAERACKQIGCRLLYYPDYPYVSRSNVDWSGKTGPTWRKICRAVSAEALLAWQDSVACYVSQMSTFFPSRADLDASLTTYLQEGGGTCLWAPEDSGVINNL